jgi:hypothetical protein
VNRRGVLKTLFGTIATAALGACDGRPNGRYAKIPPLTGNPTSSVEIHSLLETLRMSFEAKGRHVSDALMPALSEAEFRQKCAWFPGEIANELLALYSWKGGQKLDESERFAPFWFRDMIFSTPETAELEYKSMMETYGKELTPETTGVDLATCFPFAAFNGGWYVFPCGGQAIDLAHPRGIISVFQGIDIDFYSIRSMLKTCIDWAQHPLYQGGSSAWEEAEHQLWEKHNPGMFGR